MSGFPWRTLLFISVALNLLVIGAVAGALGAGVRIERSAPGAAVDRMPGPRAFMAALPPESRGKVREQLVLSWVESRELRRAAAEARRIAFEAASAEPFDVERVRAAFAEMRAADQRAIAVFHDDVADALAEMSPAERREALAALARAAPARRQDTAAEPAPRRDVAPQAEDAQTRRERIRDAIRERRRARQEQQRQD